MKPSSSFVQFAVRYAKLAALLVLGMAIGVLFHYMLYRLSLPMKPFIYVAF